MKKDYERLKKIDVVRIEGREVHVFGKSGPSLNLSDSPKYLHHIIHNTETGALVYEDSFKEKKGEDLHISIGLSFIGIGLPLLINDLRSSNRKRRRKTKEYYNKIKQLKDTNMSDLKEAVKNIKVYQGTIEEVSEDLEKKLKRVDTKKSETFVKGEDLFWLKVRAHELKADAIVHYQLSSSIGTPVRYV